MTERLHFSCLFVLANDPWWFDDDDFCSFCGATRESHWTMEELIELAAERLVAEQQERDERPLGRARNYRPTTEAERQIRDSPMPEVTRTYLAAVKRLNLNGFTD